MAPSDLPVEDLLTQLAEECGELIQAAMKIVRYDHGDSSTAVSASSLRNHLVEEMADVQVVIETMLEKQPSLRTQVNEVRLAKTIRWNKRLNHRNDER